jgi:replicative DNA helicase
MLKEEQLPWKSRREGFISALKYMKGRMEGTIKTYRTPWSKVNEAGVDGIEWNSMVIIGGRPGTGKTLIKDQIIREGFKLNKGQNIKVLEFTLEMVSEKSRLREFASVAKKSYRYLSNAGNKEEGALSMADFETCKGYAIEASKLPVDEIEMPPSIEEFEAHVVKYLESNAVIENGVKIYCNTVVTLDHSILIKGVNKHELLYLLGETTTKLKRKYPIIFIILSQLGRQVESHERNEDGKYGNYILETDLFGADALLQHADLVIGINRPAKKFIKHYGPDRFIIEDDSVLVFHFIKCRNGDTRMSFFRAKYKTMEIEEMETPPRHTMGTVKRSK